MTRTRLIINADDFGWSRGITDAIRHAHECGIVTSTSCMAHQPASVYAAQILRDLPCLGVGVHLNLCAGRPVLPARDVPSLVQANGLFHEPAALFRRLWRFQISAAEIEAEFRAQIRWLRERGITPLHADSHLHVHLYPAAIGAFIRAVSAEGIRYVRTPRCTAWPSRGFAGGPHAGRLARRIAVQSYRGAVHFAALRRFEKPHSRVFCRGNDPRQQDAASIASSWIAILDALPAGVFELACHPGSFEAGFSTTDRIARQREEELGALTSSALREALQRNAIELIRYADLGSQQRHQTHVAEAPAA
jgi:predicted glycoside hydrolase/deacetylase ChbG (UPF0249 family)